MTADRVKPLQVLVMMRERQIPKLEEALTAQQQLLAERQGEREEAQQRRDECAALEDRARQDRLALIGGSFRPTALTALDHAIDTLATRTAQAAQTLSRSEAALRKQEQAVAAARTDVVRNQERINRFKERIDNLLKERERAVEESADEESEEGAAARLHRQRPHAEPSR